MALAAASLPACGASDDDASGAAGGTATDPTPSTLAFLDSEAAIRMAPGAVRELRVVAGPPGKSYRVTLGLLGDAQNASLDRSVVDTDPDTGQAVVSLTAPTANTTFTVRASAGKLATTAPVAVSAIGFATLQVRSAYSGQRFISYWVATVGAGALCAELSAGGTPPADGDLMVQGSPTEVLELSDVPVGPKLAVTLRAGHYIGGCVEVEDLTPNAVNEVTVPVVDRPMQFDGAELELSLSTVDDSDAVQNAALSHADATLEAMLNEPFLDMMKGATTTATAASAFEQARSERGWDAGLAAALGDDPNELLRAKIRTWMELGANELAGANLVEGSLTASETNDSQALFQLDRFGRMDAGVAGFTTDNMATWSADPDDKLQIGTTLSWLPSKLLTAVAENAAIVQGTLVTTAPDALAAALSCDTVAETLTAAGDSAESFAGCDVACTAQLCLTTLREMWQRGVSSSSVEAVSGSWAISASGAASVDEEARPLRFNGSWLGTLKTPTTTVSVTGAASAAAKQTTSE
jgi:hypothetical protein